MRALLVVAALAAPAFADDADPPPTFHLHQIGISARFGVGMRGIATYNNKDYCGTVDSGAATGFASVCTGRAPLSLDLEAAYGVATHVELLVELRIGLERDFGATPSQDGPRPLHVAPGARFFFSEAKRIKLFVQPEFVFDLAGYKDSTGANLGNDYGFRGLEGVWIDLHRTYGLYFFIGETAEFKRWLDAEFEVGIGFQGRYP